jgi:hypothetical protein
MNNLVAIHQNPMVILAMLLSCLRTTVLCQYCEKASHAYKDCPHLSMPKPIVVTYATRPNELIFHEVMASPGITFKHDSGKVGRISGGFYVCSRNSQWTQVDCSKRSPMGFTFYIGWCFQNYLPTKANLSRLRKNSNIPIKGTKSVLALWGVVCFGCGQVWLDRDLGEGLGLLLQEKVLLSGHFCCWFTNWQNKRSGHGLH